ncbi:MAG TPA: isocitrate/isopropylmalate family dehydrogenase [Polyangiaceae bacterium]|nr:isocitrate/isopropylmalate family dehydrogenase [Polyangiaceae bacterium]
MPAGSRKIAVIAGDGIGPEVIAPCVRLLEWYRRERNLALELWPLDLGAERYLREGVGLSLELRERIGNECAAVLLGAIGDPRIPDSAHAREIVLGMRQGFDLFANIRPVRALSDALVPLKSRVAADVDFVVVRENTEGAYAGLGRQLRRGTAEEVAIDEDINTRRGVERLIRAGFELARSEGRARVHLADKSNALRYGQELWRRVFLEVAGEYPQIEARAEYVDALCYRVLVDPGAYQVIITNNLFGDIISDLCAVLQGGLGMAASANVRFGATGELGLFEPVHGSAPELAGRDVANPFGALRSTGLLLEHLGWPEERMRIERSIARALAAGLCTADVGGLLGTRAAAEAVIEAIAKESS